MTGAAVARPQSEAARLRPLLIVDVDHSTASSSPPTGHARQTCWPTAALGTRMREDGDGTTADKAKAAAIKTKGGGTAGTVTTDCTGNGYEVTITKTNGSKDEVDSTSRSK